MLMMPMLSRTHPEDAAGDLNSSDRVDPGSSDGVDPVISEGVDTMFFYGADTMLTQTPAKGFPILSVSNGSNPLEQFRVSVGTGTEPLQRFLSHENLDYSTWAGFTTKNPAFQAHNFGSN
jgi:hypothetical protein